MIGQDAVTVDVITVTAIIIIAVTVIITAAAAAAAMSVTTTIAALISILRKFISDVIITVIPIIGVVTVAASLITHRR